MISSFFRKFEDARKYCQFDDRIYTVDLLEMELSVRCDALVAFGQVGNN